MEDENKTPAEVIEMKVATPEAPPVVSEPPEQPPVVEKKIEPPGLEDERPPEYNFAEVSWYQKDGNELIEKSRPLFRGLISIVKYLEGIIEKDPDRGNWLVEIDVHQTVLETAKEGEKPTQKQIVRKILGRRKEEGGVVHRITASEALKAAYANITPPEMAMGVLQSTVQNIMNASSLKTLTILAVFDGIPPLPLTVLTTSEPVKKMEVQMLMEGTHVMSEEIANAVSERYGVTPSWRAQENNLIVPATRAMMDAAARQANPNMRVVK